MPYFFHYDDKGFHYMKEDANGNIRIRLASSDSDLVCFDDLKITNASNEPTIAATDVADYYPFGLRMMGNLNSYRFGYHSLSRSCIGSEYAEDETEETGCNSFEARMHNPVIGRWLSVDPARQFASPYVGMGNEPVSGVDPDGEWTEFGAAWRRFGASIIGLNPGKIYEVDGEWGFNTGVKNGAGATFNYGKYEAEFWDRHWDRVSYGYEIVWRRMNSDVYFIEGSFDLTFIGGGGAEFGFALSTRGPNAGTLYGYRTFKFHMGYMEVQD